MKSQLYRNKYIIGLYACDELETCITVLNNAREFAKFMNITEDNAITCLHYLFHNICKFINLNNKRAKVVFIDDTEDEDLD